MTTLHPPPTHRLGHTPEGREVTLMIASHDAFLRDMEDLLALVRLGADTGALTGPHVWAAWQRAQHMARIQLKVEDHRLWPALHRRLDENGVSDGAAERAVLDQLDRRRIGLTAPMDALEGALLESALPHQADGPAAHLARAYQIQVIRVESLVLPLARDILTPQEWADLGLYREDLLGRKGLAAFYPWLLDRAPVSVQHSLLAALPWHRRWRYHRRWEPRYERFPTAAAPSLRLQQPIQPDRPSLPIQQTYPNT